MDVATLLSLMTRWASVAAAPWFGKCPIYVWEASAENVKTEAFWYEERSA